MLALLLLLMAVFGHAQDASGLLEKSRKHVKEQHSIAYTYTAYWPNPVGEVDTPRGECRLLLGSRTRFDMILWQRPGGGILGGVLDELGKKK